MDRSTRIAVIGAGIAGLSCATALQSAGLQVEVFDKSSHPAGRMSTRRGDGWQCDHGAQYFTARDADFRCEVARWQDAGVAALWTPRMQVIEGISRASRASSVERFVGIPRMSAPAEFLADGLALTTSTTIRQLQVESGGWRVDCGELGSLGRTFGAVVLALPAPQVAPLLGQAAPDLADRVGSVTMLGCWALMLRYATPVDLPFDAAFVNHGPLRWIARDTAKPGRSGQQTWLLHANAAWSEAHLERDADGVAAALIAAFRELGAPAPQAWTAHRWRYAEIGHPLDQGSLWDARLGLGLCGDWLGSGKVEGAWLSGRALARCMLEAA